jgi:DNA-binding XRE family transcriptional regulator
MKTYSLEELTDEMIGKKGTPERDSFDAELKAELIGYAIREARKKRNLTQAELGEIVGVQKAQISKIENSISNARLETILKVFRALNAKVNFQVELLNENISIV